MEANLTYTLNFPENSGFEKTDIFFYSGQPQLPSVFFDGTEQQAPMPLFVTDSTIAKLPAFDSFTQNFRQGKDFLTVLPAGEAYKDIEHVLEIVRRKARYKVFLQDRRHQSCFYIHQNHNLFFRQRLHLP